MDGDGNVGRKSPGGGRPDHRVPGTVAPIGGNARDHREIDVNAGRGFVFVFQFGLGQGGAIVTHQWIGLSWRKT